MLKIVFFIHDSYMYYIDTVFFLLHTDTQSMNGLQMFFALQQIFNVQFD